MIDLFFDAVRSLLWLALALSISLSVSFTLSQFARLGRSSRSRQDDDCVMVNDQCTQP